MSSAMLRSELAARLAQTLPGVPAPQVEEAVRLLTETLAESLAAGKRIEVRGFGGFSLHVHPPKLARNPKTGERVEAGQRRTPHFKPARELRERIGQAWSLGRGSTPSQTNEELDSGPQD